MIHAMTATAWIYAVLFPPAAVLKEICNRQEATGLLFSSAELWRESFSFVRGALWITAAPLAGSHNDP